MKFFTIFILILFFPLSFFSKDKRCGNFGWNGEKLSIAINPLFYSGISREEKNIADKVRALLIKLIDLSGHFIIYSEKNRPLETALEWDVDSSINWTEWEKEGVYILIKGRVKLEKGEVFSINLHTYLIEEGDEIHIKGGDRTLEGKNLNKFVSNFVNNLIYCITGFPGIFGTRIAFSKIEKKGEKKQIWIINIDGGDEKKITNDDAIHILPSWSPYGVAYSVFNEKGIQIFIEGKAFSKYENSNTGISFSLDGKYAAVTLGKDENMEIYILFGKNGEIFKRITSHSANDLSPTWSPDGKKIAFVSDRSGSPQVYIYDLEKENLFQLTLQGSYNTSPDWSPKGFEIAYTRRINEDKFAIFLINLNTMEEKMLSSFSENAEEPSFSPDGKYIVFTSNRNGGKKLFIMKRDGSNVRQIGRGDGEYFTPSWEKFFY